MTQWNDLWVALSLLMVFEGIMPFLSPAQFRKNMQALLELDDFQIRTIGLISMVGGLGMLYWVH